MGLMGGPVTRSHPRERDAGGTTLPRRRGPAALAPVARALALQLPVEQTAALVVEGVRSALGALAVGIWLVDEARGQLRLVAQSGLGASIAPAVAVLALPASGPLAHALQSAGHVQIAATDFARLEPPPMREVAASEDWRSIVVQPLVVGAERPGVLVGGLSTRRQLGDSARTITQAFADLGAVAIDQLRLRDNAASRFQEAEAAADELRAINERLVVSSLRQQSLAQIAQSLVRAADVSGVVEMVIQQSLDTLGADAAAVWLADPSRRELTLLAARGFSQTVFATARRASYDAPLLAALVARSGRSRVVEDLVETPTLSGRLDEAEGLRGRLALPLYAAERLVGVLDTATRAPTRFTPLDLEFSEAVADLFAIAIESARLHDQVRRLLRLREDFMAAAAHELRTPVTVIRGQAQMLLAAETIDPRSRPSLESIARQTDRITHLIDDLLASMRVRPGDVALDRQRFDLSAQARQQVETATRTYEGQPLRLVAAGPLVVHADRQLIGNVLGDLLDHAVRYSPARGEILVEVSGRDGEALVSVTDHGVGIPRDRQPYVFEPFYEPIAPGAPGYVGIVSLGLYLSKQIVEAHGGRIGFISTVGEGSTFWFILPLGDTFTPSPAGAARVSRGGT